MIDRSITNMLPSVDSVITAHCYVARMANGQDHAVHCNILGISRMLTDIIVMNIVVINIVVVTDGDA